MDKKIAGLVGAITAVASLDIAQTRSQQLRT